MEFKTVFGPQINGPSNFYRIPSLITAKTAYSSPAQTRATVPEWTIQTG